MSSITSVNNHFTSQEKQRSETQDNLPKHLPAKKTVSFNSTIDSLAPCDKESSESSRASLTQSDSSTHPRRRWNSQAKPSERMKAIRESPKTHSTAPTPATLTEGKPFWKKIISHGIPVKKNTGNGKKPLKSETNETNGIKPQLLSQVPTEKNEPGETKSQKAPKVISDGVLINDRRRELHTVSALPEKHLEPSEEKQFGKEWIDKTIVNSKKIKNTLNDLLLEFQDNYQNNEGEIPESVKSEWGKRLFLSVVEAIVENKHSMPFEICRLAQMMSSEAKDRFSKVDSDTIVWKILFLNFFIPPLSTTKNGTLAAISAKEQTIIVECMRNYVEKELKEVPPELMSIVAPSSDKNKLQEMIASYLYNLSDITTLCRGVSKEEQYIQRWGEHFGKEWICKTIANKVQNTLNELKTESEQKRKNDKEQIPESVKSEWGRRLFSAFVKTIIENKHSMPSEICGLAQMMNLGIIDRFPQANSNTIVWKMLFFNFFTSPLLFPKNGVLPDQAQVTIVKCMQNYLNKELEKMPPELISITEGTLTPDLPDKK